MDDPCPHRLTGVAQQRRLSQVARVGPRHGPPIGSGKPQRASNATSDQLQLFVVQRAPPENNFEDFHFVVIRRWSVLATSTAAAQGLGAAVIAVAVC